VDKGKHVGLRSNVLSLAKADEHLAAYLRGEFDNLEPNEPKIPIKPFIRTVDTAKQTK